jgi:hypothetical protein
MGARDVDEHSVEIDVAAHESRDPRRIHLLLRKRFAAAVNQRAELQGPTPRAGGMRPTSRYTT